MHATGRRRGRRYWIRLTGFAGLSFVALAGLSLLGFSWLLAYTALHPATQTLGETPDDWGLTYETIDFTTADGLRLGGWYLPGRNGATVIFCHGFARDRGELLPEAAWLAARGYGALLFDSRAHGSSDGAHVSLGYLEATDVRAAVDFVRRRAPEERVGVVGYSMGAVAAIRAAAADSRIRAVVAVSPFSDLRALIDHRLKDLRPLTPLVVWWAERMTGLDPDDLRPVDDVATLAPRPILIMQGEADDLLPPDSGRQLYLAAGEPKALWSVPAVAHVDFRQAVPQTYKARLSDFFQRYLPPNE